MKMEEYEFCGFQRLVMVLPYIVLQLVFWTFTLRPRAVQNFCDVELVL